MSISSSKTEQHTKRQFFFNLGSSYAVRLLTISADFFILPLMIYHLGLEETGVFLLAKSSVALFMQSEVGMGTATIRHSALLTGDSSDGDLNTLANTSLAYFWAIGAVASILFLAILLPFWEALSGTERSGNILTIIVVTAFSNIFVGMLAICFRSLLIGFQRYDLANSATIAQILLRTALVVALLLFGGSLLTVVVVDSVAVILGTVLSLVLLKRNAPGLRFSSRYFSFRLLKTMLPFSLQVSGMSLVGFVLMQTDNLMIGAVIGVAAVPIYTGGFRLYQATRELCGTLVQPLMPYASRNTRNSDEQKLLITRYTLALNVVVSLACFPVILNADRFIRLWLGEGYARSQQVAIVLTLGVVLGSSHWIPLALFQSNGEVRAYLRLHALWGTLSLILGYWWAHVFGIVGVALATTIPLVLLEPIYILVAHRYFQFPIISYSLRSILLPITLGAVCAGVLHQIGIFWTMQPIPAMIASTAAFAVLYVSLSAAMLVDSSDRKLILESLRGLPLMKKFTA